RDHQFAVLVAVLGDGLGEHELAGALALLLPPLARARLPRQHVAGPDGGVVLVVLLGMDPAATTAATGPSAGAARAPGQTRRRLAGAEPRLADLGSQGVVRVELRARLHERRRRDGAAGVRVADAAREQQDVARLDGEGALGHR